MMSDKPAANFRLVTPRLLIRQWREEDRAPLAALNADTNVMRYFEKTLTREESDAALDRMQLGIEERGYGFAAAELRETGELIGIIGLFASRQPLPFPENFREIGWRLAERYWGKGYASEGAAACVKFGFNEIKAPGLFAVTAIHNLASRRVMEKLGMQLAVERFDHPVIPEGHPVRAHCGYSLLRSNYAQLETAASR